MSALRRTPGMRKQLRLRKRKREQELDFLAARESYDERLDRIERVQSTLIRAIYMTSHHSPTHERQVKTFLFENGLL